VAAVITAPALTAVGVSEPAAHMFIFYYAVLSEVSPPTALACVAVSAITGGNAYKTMWLAGDTHCRPSSSRFSSPLRAARPFSSSGPGAPSSCPPVRPWPVSWPWPRG
jgi:hypothetical protein